jgi:nucleotide-binding universal stress UspA family protein
MEFKTILVHVAPDGGDDPRVKVAAQLARQFGAELMGVGARSFLPDRDPRLTHLDGLQLRPLREALNDGLTRAQARMRELAGDTPLLWRSALEDPDDLLVHHANRADLIVADRPEDRRDHRDFAELDDLILESGLPVLALPPGQDSLHLRHVMFGWANTVEARRALAAALPFLARAETVSVVSVCTPDESERVAANLSDVVARLTRHGVLAEAVVYPTLAPDTGKVLLDYAAANKADLIAVGAYGRSRMRQWALGGVTSHLLKHAWFPVLFVR